MKKLFFLLVILVGIGYAQPQNPVFTTRQDTTIKGIVGDSLDARIPFANVKQFGVTGDGVTNDATNLQTAITSIGKGTLYFPKGNYNLSSVVTFPDSINLVFMEGAILMDSVVIKGGIDAGYYQIFSAGVSLKDAKIDGAKVDWFGDNVTPGTTDMSVPMKRAIASVMDLYPKRCGVVLLGDSEYLITENNVIGSYQVSGSTPRWGFKMKGVGWQSRLIFKPSGAGDFFLYDGGDSTEVVRYNSLIGAVFEDFQIEINPDDVTSGYVNLFRLNGQSGNVTSNLQLRRLRIYGDNYGESNDRGGYVVKCASNVNNSESVIDNCYIWYMRTLLYLSNNEAVTWNIYNTHFELGRGDVIISGEDYPTGQAGGDVAWYGGSVISEPGYDFSLLNYKYGYTNFTFSSIRTEFRDSVNQNYLVKLCLNDTLYPLDFDYSTKAIISFNDCDLAHPFGVMDVLALSAYTQVSINFNGCYFGADANKTTVGQERSRARLYSRYVSGGVPSGLPSKSVGGVWTTLTFNNGECITPDAIFFEDTITTSVFSYLIKSINCRNYPDYTLGKTYPLGRTYYEGNAFLPLIFTNNLSAYTWTVGKGFTSFFDGSFVFRHTDGQTFWMDSLGVFNAPKLSATTEILSPKISLTGNAALPSVYRNTESAYAWSIGKGFSGYYNGSFVFQHTNGTVYNFDSAGVFRPSRIAVTNDLTADSVSTGGLNVTRFLKVEDIDFTNAPTDSTAVPSGYLYMRGSDGIIRRKY